ncbi:MAG: hypothetical protein Kow0022_10390 [Phycisphaerales bacterium]
MGKQVRQTSWLKRAIHIDGTGCADGRSRLATSARLILSVSAALTAAAGVLAALPTRAWIPGLCAALACQIAVVSGLGLLLARAVRARSCAILWGLALLTSLWPIISALPRQSMLRPQGEHPSISLLIVNAYSLNTEPQQLLHALEAQRADIVIITEPSPDVLRPLTAAYRAGPGTLLRCPPTRREHSWIVVHTRYSASIADEPSDGILNCRVETPAGPVHLIATHLLSPRTSARNATAFNQVDRITTAAGSSEPLPLIIAGDFNATPTSNTSRMLADRTGTRRCKPLLRAGTYPADWPAPFRLCIDDALVSDHFRVTAWQTIHLPGSDHRGVRLSLEYLNPP